MGQHSELTPVKLQYYTEQLAVKIGDHYYNKKEIDGMLEHNAQAYYYSAQEWADKDPILKPGEIGIDSTNGFMKIGDGIHHWTEMDFAIFPVSLSNRGDNLLLKDSGDNLFLGEAKMTEFVMQIIRKYHSEGDTMEFVTEDGYSLITKDGYMFTQMIDKKE